MKAIYPGAKEDQCIVCGTGEDLGDYYFGDTVCVPVCGECESNGNFISWLADEARLQVEVPPSAIKNADGTWHTEEKFILRGNGKTYAT